MGKSIQQNEASSSSAHSATSVPREKAERENTLSRNDFYLNFEEHNRGPRELIKSRLHVYLPFVLHCQELYDECSIIDLGCGRGEWLELMAENGFSVFGVDLDDGMLSACKKRDLPAEKKDALAALQELPAQSQTIISGFHIAEHLSFETLKDIVKESLRVLRPGGLLILETPNPENIIVASSSFYIDPTHNRPLPPQLLSFLPEYFGFQRTKVLRLQESEKRNDEGSLSVFDILGGTSPDYAVVAQKKTSKRRMALFDSEFEKEYGITIETIAQKYEELLAGNLRTLESMMHAKSEETGSNLNISMNALRDHMTSSEQGIADKLVAFETRIGSLEQSATARLDQLTARVDSSEQSATARLDQLAARVDSSEQSATARLDQLAARVDSSEQSADAKLDQLAARVDSSEQSATARLDQLAARVDSSEQSATARLDQLAARVDSSEQSADARLDQLAARVDSSEYEADLRFSMFQNVLDEVVLSAATRMVETHQKLLTEIEERIALAERNARETETAFRNSRSWRITAPYRALGDFSRKSWQKIKNLFKPFLAKAISFTVSKPNLTKTALVLLRPFPGLKGRMKRLALARGVISLPVPDELPQTLSTSSDVQSALLFASDASSNCVQFELASLSPYACKIYADLKSAIERKEREN